nr:uncharacterized protein LOC104880645 [Ipomoea batatas]GMC63458.1 uncharacterized protein LOC104880645 [Ipomoea batatas]
MLLRSSISTTKKFFQKTLDTFKSFLSSGYQKLPKSPPCTPFPCPDNAPHYKDLERFYSDFTAQWDETEKGKCRKRTKKRDPPHHSKAHQTEADQKGSTQVNFNPNNNHHGKKGDDEMGQKRKKIVYNGKKYQEFSSLNGLRKERSYVVAQKLKELKMIDNSNEEHMLDVEEILHYYSRLTCPAYLDIVDKFFMEMYSELFSIIQLSPHHHHPYNSRSDNVRSFHELY